MTAQNPTSFLISIIGRDQTGVVSAVTGYLFEIGANLADSSFAVLGEAFEFSCIATFEADTSREDLEKGLAELALLNGARITVSSFHYDLERGADGEITHLVEIKGGDRPGLVARISEVLVDYDANIVRMSSRRVPLDDGAFDYRTRFAVNVPAGREAALEAALYNTAGSLRLECSLEAAH
ncbi:MULTISPECIES: glycine cleavage system protein R [Kordiimonas]|uniref:Glycine cleavage system transcriptional repressor n=1 Tax=Kordiimonas lacus TaxID=637679 RepID=A0A1G6VV46_9PROT|nr:MULTISPECIES: ACT domain-containing protein [Kordiimonas]SDD57502.1 glycine cleavage system transcriptional repressor [Kordiimonas lacus]